MATLDPSIALAYRFPKIDTPMEQYANAFKLQQAQMGLEEARRQRALLSQYESQRQALGPNASHEDMLNLDLRSGLMSPDKRAALLQGESNRRMQLEAKIASDVARLQQKHAIDMLKLDQAERMGADKNAIAKYRAVVNAAHMQNIGLVMKGRASYEQGMDLNITDLMSIPKPGQAPEATQVQPTKEAGLPSFQQARAAYVPGKPFTQEIDPTTIPAEEMAKPVAALPVGQGVPGVRAQAEAQAQETKKPIPTPPKPAEYYSWPKKRQDAHDAAVARTIANQQAKIDINLAGGRESVFNQRVIMGGNQAAKDLENVVQLPLTASTGFFGGRKQGPGLLDAGREVLANTMTGQEAQSYNAMATGFQRSLAAIEAMGLMPSGALTHQMDAVLFKEGDTNLTKLHKLAQTRQIIEAGLEVLESNPRVSPEEKGKVTSILKSVRKSVPFTHSDLINLAKEQAQNPSATLRDVMGKSGPKEGEEATSKSGKPMVYRNGRWEYK